MDRRGFLKTAGAAAGVSCLAVVSNADAAGPARAVYTKSPSDLFTEVQFPEGQVFEFPLVFPRPDQPDQYPWNVSRHASGAYTIDHRGSFATLVVASSPICASGTHQEIEAGLKAQLDRDAGTLLLYAARGQQLVPDGTREELVKSILARLPVIFARGAAFCEVDGHLIGATNAFGDLVIPHHGKARPVWDNNKMTWTASRRVGQAILYPTCVAGGKIKE